MALYLNMLHRVHPSEEHEFLRHGAEGMESDGLGGMFC